MADGGQTAEHAAADLNRQKRPFTAAARRLTDFAGSMGAVILLGVILAAWMAIGVVEGFSRTWELVITIGMPFLTVLMMIVLQHTQNHDSRAMQLKLDELIRTHGDAEDGMITVEDADTGELERVQEEFRRHVRSD